MKPFNPVIDDLDSSDEKAPIIIEEPNADTVALIKESPCNTPLE